MSTTFVDFLKMSAKRTAMMQCYPSVVFGCYGVLSCF